MCCRVNCKECGKFSWGGCGKHLTTLYSNIETGKHCMCRPWPGVAKAAAVPSAQSKPENVPAASTTTATGEAKMNS